MQKFEEGEFDVAEIEKKFERILPNEKIEFEYTVTPKVPSAKVFKPLEYIFDDDEEIVHHGTATTERILLVESVAAYKERTSLHLPEWIIAVALLVAAIGCPYLSIKSDVKKFNALKKKF